MSKSFDLNDGSAKGAAKKLRLKAVESALILINSALADNAGYIKDATDGDLISRLADKIEAAVNNVE